MKSVAPSYRMLACAAWFASSACNVEHGLDDQGVNIEDGSAATADDAATDDRCDAGGQGCQATGNSAPDAAAGDGSELEPARECNAVSEWMWHGQATYAASAGLDKPFDCGAMGSLVVASGPPENRVNLVLLGDGYQQAELATSYTEHIDRFVAHMFSAEGEPYLTYKRYINVCRLDVASKQSGTDIPDEGVSVDTAFDGNGSDQTRLGVVDGRKVQSAYDKMLSGTRVRADWVAVTLNVNRWFNSGGSIMVWSGARPGKPDVALHEAGHAFHGLADEYGGTGQYSGNEPGELNVTKEATGQRWKEWLGYDQPGVGMIGAYEGGRYFDHGIYRPSKNSKMNQVPALHNAPCMQKIVRDIYEIVRPVDSWTRNDRPLDNPCALDLTLVDPARLQVTWSVDGKEVVGAAGSSFDVAALVTSSGQHEVVARVFDSTALVRGTRDGLEQSVTWTLVVP